MLLLCIAIPCATVLNKLKRNERVGLQLKVEKMQERARNGTEQDIESYLPSKESLKEFELHYLEASKIRRKERKAHVSFCWKKSRPVDQTIRVLTKDNLDTVLNTKGLLAEMHAI